MSDWIMLLGQALAIIGLAIGLSALSYARYDARERGARLRNALDTPVCRLGCDLAVLLVGLGLGLFSRSLRERVVWTIYVLLYAVVAFRTWIVRLTAPKTGTETGEAPNVRK